jgi:hypothetical protein
MQIVAGNHAGPFVADEGGELTGCVVALGRLRCVEPDVAAHAGRQLLLVAPILNIVDELGHHLLVAARLQVAVPPLA